MLKVDTTVDRIAHDVPLLSDPKAQVGLFYKSGELRIRTEKFDGYSGATGEEPRILKSAVVAF
jgi:hypothetical protein